MRTLVITKECPAPHTSDYRASRDTSALALIIPAPTPYSSTNALFHVPLTGDLVFKLNPGPVRSLDNGSCSIVSRQWQSDTTTALPNIGNPIAAIVSQCAYQELRANRDTRNLIEIRPSRMNMRLHQQMLLCNLNARSVRNKTAQILDFIVDRKVDSVTITEHWLTANDSAEG